jgi:pyruvate dehydrogenase E2 component (dihydrolipoamide acetyltransferase)
MPSLGADMTEGTLLEWLVHAGDVVHRGDIVAVVDTAKSAIDIEVFEDGRIDELLVKPGATVAVGVPLARLAPVTGDGAAAGPAPVTAPGPAPVTAPVSSPVSSPVTAPVTSPIVRHLAHERGIDLSTVAGTGPHGAVTRADVQSSARGPQPAAEAPASPAAAADTRARVSASPVARRRAGELGIDLASVHGTGTGGVLTLADVEAAAATGPPPAGPAPAAPAPARSRRSRGGPEETAGPAEPAPTPGTAAEKAAAMREAIGALMARSKREIPHYYLQTTVDLDCMLTWLERVNADRPVVDRILPAAVLLKAAAVAVREVPEMNGFYVDGQFRAAEHVHLGVAVSLRGGGLVAPALHDADRLSVEELMARLKDLVARTRSGRLRGSEMSDPTLTVTNLGDQGVEAVHGVIYPPQVALVGFGRVHERPWAVDGMLTVRRVLVATLAADHRVSDGHRGGRYLAAVDGALQHPEEL